MPSLLDHPDVLAELEIPQLDQTQSDVVDLGAALRSALQHPVAYPPLGDSVFAGDAVAILLQEDLPHPKRVVQGLLSCLAESNVADTDITVIVLPRTAETLGIPPDDYRPTGDDDQQPPPQVPIEFGFQTVQFQVHDPDNATGQAYLAANAAGLPVYLNRSLVEADVVLPVGRPIPGQRQEADFIYPAFSDRAARERFDQQEPSLSAVTEERDLANEMLGAFFVVQLICGPGDTVQQVVCGERQQINDQAQNATNQLWEFTFQGHVDAVVGTIETDAGSQTWDQVADAIVFADPLVSGDGPILVWSELDAKPPQAMKQAAQYPFDESVRIDRLPDNYRQLAQILAQRPVFLRSNMPREVVEGLGLGFLESTDEVLRATRSFSRRLLIRDAHRCQRVARSVDAEAE